MQYERPIVGLPVPVVVGGRDRGADNVGVAAAREKVVILGCARVERGQDLCGSLAVVAREQRREAKVGEGFVGVVAHVGQHWVCHAQRVVEMVGVVSFVFVQLGEHVVGEIAQFVL